MKETRGRKPGVAKATVTFMLERQIYAELLARVAYGKRSVWIQEAIEAKLEQELRSSPLLRGDEVSKTLVEIFASEEQEAKPLFL